MPRSAVGHGCAEPDPGPPFRFTLTPSRRRLLFLVWFAWTVVLSVWRLIDGLDRTIRIGRSPVCSTRIDVNRASPAELRLLPGFGPVRARAAVLERLRGGRFCEPADLLRIPGVGPETVRRITPWIQFDPHPRPFGSRR